MERELILALLKWKIAFESHKSAAEKLNMSISCFLDWIGEHCDAGALCKFAHLNFFAGFVFVYEGILAA